MYAKMLKETKNEETRLFWQIFVIGGILIKGGPGHLGHPLATAMILRQDRSPNKFFHKKKHLNQNENNFFFQNEEDSSQVTWQFFETSKNCMTLLWREHVVLITIAYLCTLKS